MEIYKIITVALITAILCIYLKGINNEFFILTLICGGIIVLTLSLNYLSETFTIFNKLANLSNIDANLFKIVIKVTLVAYLIEFTCNIIDDFGIKSLSDKVAFVGKLLLICMSAPIFLNLIEIVVDFLD